MALRKVLVASTQRSTPKELHTEATTWGQLKDSLGEFGNLDEMRAVVKETRNDLTSNDAVLPEGPFTILMSPKKIKAGSIQDVVAILEALKEKFNEGIDEIIEDVEDGAYTTSKSTVATSGKTTVDLSEDLRKLAAGTF